MSLIWYAPREGLLTPHWFVLVCLFVFFFFCILFFIFYIIFHFIYYFLPWVIVPRLTRDDVLSPLIWYAPRGRVADPILVKVMPERARVLEPVVEKSPLQNKE